MLQSRQTPTRSLWKEKGKERSLLRTKALLEVMAVLLRSLLEEGVPVMTRRSINTVPST